MLSIPPDIVKQFAAILTKKKVPFSSRADCRKWLRYYLDFRAKYQLPDSRSEQVRLFVEKLRDKVAVQQHRICFVIGQFAYESIANQPLSRIYGTAEQLPYRGDAHFLLRAG